MPTPNEIAHSGTTCKVLCCLVMGTGTAIVLHGDSTLAKVILIPLAAAVLLSIILNVMAQHQQEQKNNQTSPEQQQTGQDTPSRHTLPLNIMMAALLAMNLSTILRG